MAPEIAAAAIGAAGQFLANEQSAQSAQRQMEFQERMSSTAYQRAMQDMREAGLNPILAAKVGGASSPAGAMSQFGNIGAAAVQGGSTAYQAQTQRLQQEAQATKISSDIDKITSDISVNEAMKERINADVVLLSQKKFTEEEQTKLVKQTALKMEESVGIEKAIRVLQEMEAKANSFIESEYVNPYTARLFMDYGLQVLKELRNLFSLRKGKTTKTTTYGSGGKVEVTK